MRKDLLKDPRVVEVGAAPHGREVMDIRQASQYLRVSPGTFCRYLADKKIPAFQWGNRWRFKKSTLDRRMEQHSQIGEVRRRTRAEAASRC